MKKYENPMLQVVSIKKSDIILTSFVVDGTQEITDPGDIKSAGRRNVFDEWYEGY